MNSPLNRPTKQTLTSHHPNLRFVIVVVLAVLAIAGGLVGPSAWAKVEGNSTASGNTSAKSRIEADPPPTLFAAAQTAATANEVAAQHKKAATLIRTWVAAHGATADDKAFEAWLEKVFPPPPPTLAAEMPTVVAVSRTRTSTGVAAATWLETYGKKDIWKLYSHDQGELLGSTTHTERKAEEKQILKMTKQVADVLGARFGSAAPYVRMPSLRKDHAVKAGQKCPCSFPSRHAAAAAASESVLGALMPSRDADYRAMEAQIDYSRVYMAGHFPSDIRAGALLGDVIGDYFLITRNRTDPAEL